MLGLGRRLVELAPSRRCCLVRLRQTGPPHCMQHCSGVSRQVSQVGFVFHLVTGPWCCRLAMPRTSLSCFGTCCHHVQVFKSTRVMVLSCLCASRKPLRPPSTKVFQVLLEVAVVVGGLARASL